MDRNAYVMFRDALFKALWRDIAPLSSEIEDREHIPHERVWAMLRSMDALGLLIPEEFGGRGLTVTQYLPIISEFAKVHGGIRAVVHVHNSFAHALADLGTHEQKLQFLPGIARGDLSMAFALTEPGRGTGLDT